MFITKTRHIKDLNRFQAAAKELNPAIETVLLFDEETLRFTIGDEVWTLEEDQALDSLIEGFEDIDISLKIPKIYSLAKDPNIHFHAINYKLGLKKSLIPVREIVKGEVRKVTWYSELDDNDQPIDPILQTEIIYTRDEKGDASSRITTRSWFNIDGSLNEEVKTTNKYYFINDSDVEEEGIKRRDLLVKTLRRPIKKAIVAALMPLGYSQDSALAKAKAFFDDYRVALEDFKQNSSIITDATDTINYGKQAIIVKLEQESKAEYASFIDAAPAAVGTPFDGSKTIRQYLIQEFDI